MKKKQTLLIVDDEEKNVRLFKAVLMQENYNIVAAFNGEEALKIAGNISLDLILLDVMMFGMDGFKVCRKIKNDEKTRNIPILMLTVLTEKEDRLKAMEAGADGFMSKPASRISLLGRIESMLRINRQDCKWKT